MVVWQAIIIGLIALAIAPGYFFYFDVTPKVVALLAGTAVALAIFGAGFRVVPARRLKLFGALLLLNLVSLAVSAAASASPALSVFGGTWRRFGLIVEGVVLVFAWLVAATCAGRPDRVRAILRGVAAAGMATALYGIAQYFGWDPILPAAAYHIGEGIWTIVRPPGTLGYVSYFATWLLFVVFLGLALADLEERALWRGLAIAAAAAALVAMLLTGTRAALLGALAGGAVWLYGRGFRLSRRMAALAAVVVIAGAGFYFSPPGWQLRSRARWFAEDPWGGARLELWRDSVRMAAGRLPSGYGMEVFTASFPRFESKELARAYPDFAHESPHNIFLDALVAQGIPGFAILCALCVFGFSVAWRVRKVAPLAAALAAGVVCQQFTVFTLPTALIFYTTIALAVGLASEAAPAGPASRPLPFRVAVGLAALALVYLAVRFTVADHALARSSRGVDSGSLPAAVEQFGRYQRWRLPGASADLWYSRALIGLAQKARNPVVRLQALAQSGAAAVRATQTAEDPFNAWYNLAAVYASQNDFADTGRCLRAAIAARPRWFKPHWTLARVLQLQGGLKEAEEEAVLAAELDGGKDPEVMRTLAEIRSQSATAQPRTSEK